MLDKLNDWKAHDCRENNPLDECSLQEIIILVYIIIHYDELKKELEHVQVLRK